jgi:hypothetical protein
MIEQALAQFHPGNPPRIGNDTDTAQSQGLTEDAVRAMLLGLKEEMLQELRGEMAVAATNGNVTDTAPAEPDAPTAAPTRPTAQRNRREQPQASPDPLDAQICAFLRTHSEGGSVKELVAALDAPESKIRLRVKALAKCGHIQMRGTGRSLRYVLTAPE